MVFIFAPSHTINTGASADFGRLFNITRYGSKIPDSLVFHQSIIAIPIPNTKIKKKLKKVSARVMPV